VCRLTGTSPAVSAAHQRTYYWRRRGGKGEGGAINMVALGNWYGAFERTPAPPSSGMDMEQLAPHPLGWEKGMVRDEGAPLLERAPSAGRSSLLTPRALML
jgi:hypothetical protein